MATIDYKEKYEQALEMARQFFEKPYLEDSAGIVEYIFPELKESEDERIRKRIIHLVNKSHEQGGYALHKDEAEEMIAYLKKQAEHANFRNKIQIGDKITRNKDGVLVNLSQLNRVAKKDKKQGENFQILSNSSNIGKGEQKPADKDEPKFHEGEWVVDKNGTVKQILSYKNGIYKHTDGYSSEIFEDEWRLWDIAKDAKEGDVLFIGIDASTCIFKKLEGNLLYSYIISDGKLLVEDSHYYYEISDNVYPATKEQRDLLFQKMHEAGYEWDAINLKLNMISHRVVLAEAKEAMYDKIALSEEDERHIDTITSLLEDRKKEQSDFGVEVLNKEIAWLKSIKDRYTWKPSEEQMVAFEYCVENNCCDKDGYNGGIMVELLEQLKKLREE